MRLDAPELGPGEKARHDPETEQWSRDQHLLAALKDELSALRYSYLSAHMKRPPKWKPEPTPRPGVVPTKRRPQLNEAQVSALEAHLAKTQGVVEN